MYKHVIHDGLSFYVVQDTGALSWYRDAANNGTDSWAPNTGNQIGTGWGEVVHMFAGSDPGEIYTVDVNGNLRWYRDLLRNGSNSAGGNQGWDRHSGQIIGYGWTQFIHIFPGPNGVIYAVKPTGELMWYRDFKKEVQYEPGKFSRWANNGVGKQIGQGWQAAARIVACRNTAPNQSYNDYVIYVVKPDGSLCWYHDDRADGTNELDGHTGWGANSGKQIGQGWDAVADVVGAAHGVLYVMKRDGSLCWYKDALGDGENAPNGSDFAPNSGSRIGVGWFPYPASLPSPLQYDIDSITFNDSTPVGGNAHLTLRSDGTFTFWGHFHNSGAIDYNISFVMLIKDANDIAYTVPVSGHLTGSTGSGSHDFDPRIDSKNDDVAKNWPALVAYSTDQGHIQADSDVAALVNLSLGSAGVVLGVVALIVA